MTYLISQSSTLLPRLLGLGEKGGEAIINIIPTALFSESQDSPLEKMGEVACRYRRRHPNLPFLSGWVY